MLKEKLIHKMVEQLNLKAHYLKITQTESEQHRKKLFNINKIFTKNTK